MKTCIITGGNLEYEFLSNWLANHTYDCFIGVDGGLEYFYQKK